MTIGRVLLFTLMSMAAPALADRVVQRPIGECVVVHQVGMVRNATPTDLEHGMSVPCNLTDDDALRYYFRKLHEREEQFCPRCCCSPRWEKQ